MNTLAVVACVWLAIAASGQAKPTGSIVDVCKDLKPEDSLDGLYDRFKQAHNKLYTGESESATEERRKIFEANAQTIIAHNEKHRLGEVTYTMACNRFTDLHESEKPQHGLRRPSSTTAAPATNDVCENLRPGDSLEGLYDRFKQAHNKLYTGESDSATEERRQIFEANAQAIIAHNEKHRLGEVTYTMACNRFTDLHESEKPIHGLRLPTTTTVAPNKNEVCDNLHPGDSLEGLYERYKQAHNKVYAGESEADTEVRRKIFEDNAIAVIAHNEKYNRGEVTFKRACNRLADLHENEKPIRHP